MSEAYGVAMTKQGLALIAKIMADRSSLTVSRVMMGSGVVPEGVFIGDLEDLVEPVAPGTVSEPAYHGSTVEMTVEYRSDMNGGLKEGFLIREFGIFARDGDGEVMILYGSLAERQQYIGPWVEGGGNDVRRYPVSITIAEGTPVILDGLPGTVMTTDDVRDYCLTTLLPQLLTAAREQVVDHNQSKTAHPDLRAGIAGAQKAAEDAAALAGTKQGAIDAVGLLKRDGGGEITAAVAGVDYGLPSPSVEPGTELGQIPGRPGQHYFDPETGREYVCAGQDGAGNYLWKIVGADSAYRVFEPSDWTGDELRFAAPELGLEPKPGPVAYALRQRVGRTALEYDEESAAGVAGLMIAAVKAALDANAAPEPEEPPEEETGGEGAEGAEDADAGAEPAPAPEPAAPLLRFPTAEDGHVIFTWEQVQYLLLESNCFEDEGETVWNPALVSADEAEALAEQLGFHWKERDNGGLETVTLDGLLTAAYLPALGGPSANFEAMVTAEALQGLRFRRGVGGDGYAAEYDLDGVFVKTWGAMSAGVCWDLSAGELVVQADKPFAGDIQVLGGTDAGG